MKRTRILIGVGVALLFLASAIAAWRQPSAVDVARARCVSEGWRPEDLALLEYRGTGTLFARRETVRFQAMGSQPPKLVRVELSKPIYFLDWRVVEIRVEDQRGQPT